MISYKFFNDETKCLINKAIDIYLTIKDKNLQIINTILFTNDSNVYRFTKLDKRVFSLYLSAFIVNGKMKDILGEYDDIIIDDLLDFVNINNIEDIKSLNENEYEVLYDAFFKLDMIELKNYNLKYYNFDDIYPEIIFSFLDDDDVLGSSIIKKFFLLHNIKNFECHPSFAAIKNYAFLKGYFKDNSTYNSLNNIDDKQNSKKDIIDFNNEKIWDILDNLKKRFIGQERACEYIFYNIVNNQYLAIRNNSIDGERSIIFIDGPTGTGKTAITRAITEQLDIPFVSTSITNYSAAGYVGGDITDNLKQLYIKSDKNLDKAQRGVIIFDEFDKLVYNQNGNELDIKKAVQQQLLDFMGGGKYNITIDKIFFDSEIIEFDTSKLTFICLGALSDLRVSKTERKKCIGFGNNIDNYHVDSFSIEPDDLINLGFERELVGRFNTYLHTEEYSKDALLKILKESSISPILGFEKWIASRGKKLQIENGVYEAIAEQAYNLNTGARSLQTVINNIRTPFIKSVLRGSEDIIYLDLDTVNKINSDTMTRKGRK